MRRGKVPVIVFVIMMLSLSGLLIYNILSNRNERNAVINGTEPAMAATPDNSGNKDGDNTYNPPTNEYDGNKNNEDNPNMTDNSDTPFVPATEIDSDPKSITAFVNREYALPKDYVPDDLVVVNVPFDITGYDERKLMRSEAAKALEQLFGAASQSGYTLYGVSGYRSYNRQKDIFLDNIVRKGKSHTLQYSAIPGTSEHQTGLAMDVSCESLHYNLTDAFANSPEGKWLAINAHYYGFIIRYPENRSDVTGYAYEPWHVRYVGKAMATYMYNNDLTLEEYYKYVPSPDFDFEQVYADFINYKPTPTPSPIPTPSPLPSPTPAPSPTPTPGTTDENSDPVGDGTDNGNSSDTGNDGSGTAIDNPGDTGSQGQEGNNPGDSTEDGSGQGTSDSGNTSDGSTPTPSPAANAGTNAAE